MRIRIDIDDKLLRRAKAETVRRGCTLDALMIEALKLVMNAHGGGDRAQASGTLGSIAAKTKRLRCFED